MIKLYQFEPAWGIPNGSSYCLKLETYLRMAEIPFEIVYTHEINKAPKGKLPYIEDEGNIIPDSNFIIDYLKATYGCDLDKNLNPYESAISLAMKRLIEENLYWVAAYSRWCEPENWKMTKQEFFSGFPVVLKQIIPFLARRNIVKSLKGHGIGRHSREEIYQIGINDLMAICHFLADKPFLMGNEPTSVDASAYGLLANILWTTTESPLKHQAETLDNIKAYCDRIRSRYYVEENTINYAVQY